MSKREFSSISFFCGNVNEHMMSIPFGFIELIVEKYPHLIKPTMDELARQMSGRGKGSGRRYNYKPCSWDEPYLFIFHGIAFNDTGAASNEIYRISLEEPEDDSGIKFDSSFMAPVVAKVYLFLIAVSVIYYAVMDNFIKSCYDCSDSELLRKKNGKKILEFVKKEIESKQKVLIGVRAKQFFLNQFIVNAIESKIVSIPKITSRHVISALSYHTYNAEIFYVMSFHLKLFTNPMIDSVKFSSLISVIGNVSTIRYGNFISIPKEIFRKILLYSISDGDGSGEYPGSSMFSMFDNYYRIPTGNKYGF
ncbi:hypothetical protein [Microcystis phage Mel-JY01]